MKKSIFLFFSVLTCFDCFSQNLFFKTKKDIDTREDLYEPTVSVKINTIVSFNSGNEAFYDYEDNHFIVSAHYKNYNLEFNIDDLELQEDHIDTPEELKKSFWAKPYYFDMLKAKNVEILIKNEPEFKHDDYYISFEGDRYEWHHFFKPLYLVLGDNYITTTFNILWAHKNVNILGKGISYVNNEYNFIVYNETLEDKTRILTEWKKLVKSQYPYNLIFKLDGDYLNIYYDTVSKENFLYTLVRADQNTLNQISSFVKTEKFDSDKVTWPRHADGTCDYDNSKSAVVSTLREPQGPQAQITANKSASTAAPTTNVSVKKLMTTNCNLKLRAAEATSSNVLTVMAQGTKVKILELGKAETIDGISSNWVKVEVQKGAKDRDGKPITPKTIGWCYGGYLE